MEQRDLLEHELNILRDRLLLMAARLNLRVIDSLELEIDGMSIDILTLRRPVVRELMMVILIAKITQILERIADHVTSIARAALELNDESQISGFNDLKHMAVRAADMLRSVLDAFTSNNSEAARQLITKDNEVDEIHDRAANALMNSMTQDASKSKAWHAYYSLRNTWKEMAITSRIYAN